MCPLLVQKTHEFAELVGKQDLEGLGVAGHSLCVPRTPLISLFFFPVRLYLRDIFSYWEISALTSLIILEQVWIS